MATKTERVNVWLTPEQVAWLKTKKNVSETLRALVTEAMSLDALKASVKPAAKKPAAAAKKPAAKKAASSTRAAAPSSKRGRK